MDGPLERESGQALAVTTGAGELEAEVVRLREQCRQLLGELEHRIERVVRLPRKVLAVERRVVAAVRAHPLLALAAVALVVVGLMASRRR